MTASAEGHGAALEMLGVRPPRSARRERLIAERERVCGRTFPASVVAWFALEGAEELFHRNSNEDELVALGDLGDLEEAQHRHLRVGVENQAVVAFYVRLDQGDDPPVYDNNDQFDEPLDEIQWNRISETFTNFIYDMVSIGRLKAARDGLWFDALGRPPSETPEGLRPGPETSTAQLELRRFHGPHEFVRARWAPGDDIAQWYVEADTPERLAELTEELGLAGVPKARPRARPPAQRRRRWRLGRQRQP